MNKEILKIINKCFKCKLNSQKLNQINNLKELENFDSLNYMNFLSEIEKKFNIKLRMKDINSLYKLKSINLLIKKK
jgi:acyl carrier protein